MGQQSEETGWGGGLLPSASRGISEQLSYDEASDTSSFCVVSARSFVVVVVVAVLLVVVGCGRGCAAVTRCTPRSSPEAHSSTCTGKSYIRYEV